MMNHITRIGLAALMSCIGLNSADAQSVGSTYTSKAMLVVTRLPPGPVCHVAYVDAVANPAANELARKAADDFARGFTCGKDEVKIIGAGGRAVELATMR